MVLKDRKFNATFRLNLAAKPTPVNAAEAQLVSRRPLNTQTCLVFAFCRVEKPRISGLYGPRPKGDVSGFGGVLYGLHLEGKIGGGAAVPVPAAAWLFGSGLIGLVGIARRKTVNKA